MNDETAWVIRAQQGDDEAFTQLVETYQKPVDNLCYRMLGEPEAAEDAGQETFLRAYQNLHRYDNSRAFGTWILSIAAHYCIDRLRKRKFAVFSMDAEDEDGMPFEMPDPASPDPEAESAKRSPMIAKISPGRTAKVRSRCTTRGPKAMVRPRTSTWG